MRSSFYNPAKALLFMVMIVFMACNETEPEKPKSSIAFEKISSMDESTIEGFLGPLGISDVESFIKYGVDVYKISYKMAYKGDSIMASGLISVPQMEGGSFPLLSFQHGTMVAHNEAPSVSPFLSGNVAITSIAGAGYIVIYADLLGFGASEEIFHPYLVKDSHVDAVMSMLKAFEQIPKGDLSGTSSTSELYLLGYSQGGWITLALHQHLEENSSPYQLMASASGAGPYKPKLMQEFVFNQETYPRPHFMPYVFLAYESSGLLSSNLSTYFKEPYATTIPTLFDGFNSGAQIDEQLSYNNEELYTNDFLSNYKEYTEINTLLENNTIHAWTNHAPILLGHGEGDVFIPKSISEKMAQEFIGLNGAMVEEIYFPNLDHLGAVPPFISYAMEWFQASKQKSLTLN